METAPKDMETQGYIDEGKAIGLSEGEVHRLLAADRRRLTLDILAEGRPRDIEGLAEEIVCREGRDEVTEHAVRRATIDLYHCHLPLMADLGVIEFDRRSKRVGACRFGWG